MKAIIQRVDSAEVYADGEFSGRVERGFCVLLGVREDDSEAEAELVWNVDETKAMSALPEDAAVESSRKLIIKAPGGDYMACWEFVCGFREDEAMCIYVDAESGKQCKIEEYR